MRDTSQPLPFLRAARAVFDLSLESMIWSRRSLLMALLVGLPVIVALAYRVVLAADLRVVQTPLAAQLVEELVGDGDRVGSNVGETVGDGYRQCSHSVHDVTDPTHAVGS